MNAKIIRSLLQKQKRKPSGIVQKKLEIQWRVQRRLSFQRIRHLSFSSSSAAGKARERWGSQALYLAQFFWGVNANFFNCFFNEIWRINDVQRLMKGFVVNLVRWRCYWFWHSPLWPPNGLRGHKNMDYRYQMLSQWFTWKSVYTFPFIK